MFSPNCCCRPTFQLCTRVVSRSYGTARSSAYGRELRDRTRERIRVGPARGQPRIVQGPRRKVDQTLFQAKRRRLGRVEIELAGDEVAVHAVPGADRRPSVTLRVPGDPDARLEIHPLGVHPRLGRESLVAGIRQTGGRLRDTPCCAAGVEPIDVEVVDLVLLVLLREPGLPPHPVVHRHLRRQPPRVLRVEPEILLLDVQRERRGLPELEDAAEQEIGERQAASRSR